MNKYEKCCSQIIIRGKSRITPNGYTETHHILPKSLGGSNEPDNLVVLTAREHFICHWLLIKIYKTGEAHWKMLNALRMMRAENDTHQRYHTKITARVYESLKEEYAEIMREKMSGSGNPMYGREVSEEVKKGRSIRASGKNNPSHKPGVKEKISKAKLGVKRNAFSEEWLKNLSSNHKSKSPDFDGTRSAETRSKIGDKIRGRKQTAEEKQRRSDANKGKKREKKLCPHCGQHIAVNTYPRFHGDKCKHRK